MMKLVIVESPTKAKTIKNFLGKDFKVLSSYGHIRDLPKSTFGIDIENDFEPKYVIPTKARKNLNLLKKEAEKANEIILATDPDREGEAISWHLIEALKLKDYKRVVFHEITKTAIQNAIKNPLKLNENLSDAQQARRILDRIVGYKLSPFLWKKVARRLSAGRVQSVAVRLICEREEEIKNFKPEKYFTISAVFKDFESLLTKVNNKKLDKLAIKTNKQAEEIIKNLKNAEYIVQKIEKKEIKRHPQAPFKTSSLQQEANKKFRFSSKMTMRLAQNLYEKGYITYHRTDSLNVSSEVLNKAEKVIKEKFGNNYYTKRIFKTKGRAEEAHEAIRPTFQTNLKLDAKQKKLYDLIYNRFLASQMSSAIFDSKKVEIKADNYTFEASGSTLKFDGFLKVYEMKFKENKLPKLQEKQILKLKKLKKEDHSTMPKARYNEASLIKKLEEYEIGRPSTYATIISTIQTRNYVEKNEDRRFAPTEIGQIVNNTLKENFENIVDYKFTAEMEKKLDNIGEGKENWKEVIKNFYFPFNENLERKYKEVKTQKPEPEITDKICPKCQKPLAIKMSRFGKFLACTGFPKCKYAESLKKDLGITCPQCGIGKITEKRTKKGKIFYACTKWPDCDFALWDKPTKELCKKCGSLMVEKGKKTVCSNKDCS
ncbi:MAG: type I DNA topoisomerase [Candidatus Pacebacteria bacterium]|nr:type I DNA topoisomerase [Candidatus Paceibacterota bacterium]MDD2796390.1 type I DNA topoisomerase [Candidatus Paceibacterota bacterium]MDD3048076.1 type I DNA topoisomerase [Candidatus Paceibacterota bacterium]MDD3509829.1 type I DNA topoisomerase [Candidatus Paceibacterota bacterium]MDD3918407.1 type I DNA topoisomerase [Candidatus Paceibacterota bacterium]